jgi:hypothetical protein
LLPIFFIGTSSLEGTRINFLLFFDISVGQDNLLVALKKEEDASNVLVSDAQLKEHIFLIDEDGQWESVSLARFELLDPGNNQFVKGRILLPQVLQERENRLVPLGIVLTLPQLKQGGFLVQRAGLRRCHC